MSNTRRFPSAAWSAARNDERLERLIVDGRAVAYQDVGRGPPVILAHCSSASHTIWAPLTLELRGRYRVLAPDFLGYGASEPWRRGARLTPWSDLGAVIALAELRGEPVHLVGHSYGGVVALEAARVLGTRARSLTLIEPVAFNILAVTGRIREWRELAGVGQRMTEALRHGRDRRAAALYVKYWAGRLRWWAMPPRARRQVVATIGKVGAELATLAELSRTVGDYRSVNAPTRLIAGLRTPDAVRAIVDELLDILPNVTLRLIPGARHLGPLTHPVETTALVADHVDAVEVRAARARAASRPVRASQRSIA